MVRLTTELLPEFCLDKLAKIKVFTVIGFVRYDSVKLAEVLDQNYQEICAAKKRLLEAYSSPLINGRTLYARAKKRVKCVPTLVPWLDDLLNAGFRSNSILEICGPPGCGKTQICWSAAINMTVELKMRVLYVDTKGDFSIERVWSLLKSKYPEKNPSHLSRMNVASVTDIYELISTVDRLHKEYEDEMKRHQVLFIDSVSAVPYLGSVKNSGISLMSHLGASLKRLAAEKNVGVILTNVAVEEFHDKRDFRAEVNLKPAGDRSYWLHAPHHRILVTREGETSGRIARIVKSDRLPVGSYQRFTIENGDVS